MAPSLLLFSVSCTVLYIPLSCSISDWSCIEALGHPHHSTTANKTRLESTALSITTPTEEFSIIVDIFDPKPQPAKKKKTVQPLGLGAKKNRMAAERAAAWGLEESVAMGLEESVDLGDS